MPIDPVTAAAIAGGAQSSMKGIFNALDNTRNKMAGLEISRIQRNQRLNNELLRTKMDSDQMTFGQALGQRMMQSMRGGLEMSGSLLDTQSQNAGMMQQEMNATRFQTYLQNLQLQDNIVNQQQAIRNNNRNKVLGLLGAGIDTGSSVANSDWFEGMIKKGNA